MNQERQQEAGVRRYYSDDEMRVFFGHIPVCSGESPGAVRRADSSPAAAAMELPTGLSEETDSLPVPDPARPQRGWKPNRRRIRLLLLVMLTLYVLWHGWLAWQIRAQCSQYQWRHQPSAAAGAGVPTEVPPSGTTAGELCDKAIAARIRNERLENALPRLNDAVRLPATPWPPAMVETAATYLGLNEAALELLHGAADAPGGGLMPVQIRALDDDPIVAYLGELRHLGRLLDLEAVHAAATGHPDRAVKAVMASTSLHRGLVGQPIRFTHIQFARVSLSRIPVDVMEDVISTTTLNHQELDALGDVLEQLRVGHALEEALWAARADGDGVFRSWRIADPDIGRLESLARRLTGSHMLDRLEYLRVMGRYIAAVRLPLHEAQDQATGIDHEDRPGYALLAVRLLPHDVGPLLRIQASTLSRIEQARVMLAVEHYRCDHGGLPPAELSALVPRYLPAVPQDAFLPGVPLSYRTTPAGYEIWAPGMDAAGVRAGHGSRRIRVPRVPAVSG